MKKKQFILHLSKTGMLKDCPEVWQRFIETTLNELKPHELVGLTTEEINEVLKRFNGLRIKRKNFNAVIFKSEWDFIQFALAY